MARPIIARYCQWCEKQIRGRSDKKFCDDTCRNAFNNQRNIGEYNLVRNINHALVRNRRILADHLNGNTLMARTNREKLLQNGFQFKYCTHFQLNESGELFYFCYDYGYQPLPQDGYLVIRQQNKF
ncbi:hypothetical protein [Flavihumibacter profundi]|uniref:hypothetical protein n=1 Tax=Flavihumibacter profundi TaxID=2716883 RepID=UPI001CC7D691|nr:hypothetical protein [Flavihumibacter profundi]MBZ5857432.1 hypothetical protein [Flavihumibacter profundi]